MAPEAFFLTVAGASHPQRFCLYHSPTDGAAPRGVLLYLHPFAEEMNKSRRMAALQARLLAERGYAVLQIDLCGCGDSAGDFGDATWQSWLQDIHAAHRWLRTRCQAPLWLWGLRTGCLLATQAAAQLDEAANFLFWQPVASGRQYLQQFMRLKVAGDMMSGESKGAMEQMKTRLAAGQSIEIAGYCLSPALADGIAAAELSPMDRPGHLIWLELSSHTDATLSPVAQKHIEQWKATGFTHKSAVLPGPSFWQTTEIEDAPALLTATLEALETAST
jgi:exosortase A-associated hydrolase 2